MQKERRKIQLEADNYKHFCKESYDPMFSGCLSWMYQNIKYELLVLQHAEHLNKCQPHFREILLHRYSLNILSLVL